MSTIRDYLAATLFVVAWPIGQVYLLITGIAKAVMSDETRESLY